MSGRWSDEYGSRNTEHGRVSDHSSFVLLPPSQGVAGVWGLVGQERAVVALERALAAGRAAHAYLLVGPERVGKHTLALRLAPGLNCDGEEAPCDRCEP